MASACIAVSATSIAHAQLRLTYVNTVGLDTNRDYETQYDWHTATLPSGAYNLWLIEGITLTDPFINGLPSDNAAIDIELTPGDYTFSTYGTLNLPDSEIGAYGINLAFNNDEIGNEDEAKPAISAMAPVWGAGPGLPPAFSVHPSGNTTRFRDITMAAAGELAYEFGGLRVTLIDFWYASSDHFNDNRVGPYATTADSRLDNVARFTLRVESIVVVPEASTFTLALSGVGIVGAVAIKRRKK